MKLLLSLLVLVLAVVLVLQWRDWPPSALEPNAAESMVSPVEAPPKPAANPLDLLTPLGEMEEYEMVTQRPLFLPDRKPTSDEPEAETAADPDPLSDLARLDLNAVLITSAQSSAWIRDPENKELIRLRPGDELAGWSVQEILSDRILLERQGEKDTLILRDYKNMPPPAPPRRRPVTRRPPQQSPQAAVPSPSMANEQLPDRSQPVGKRRDAPELPEARNPRARENARQPRQQRSVQE